MGLRLDLHEVFKEILGNDNVYFQPPANVQMKFPCIVYNRDDIEVQFADNTPHLSTKRYQVTVINQDPDSDIPDKVAKLPMCSYDRFFAVENLNHDAFTIFF